MGKFLALFLVLISFSLMAQTAEIREIEPFIQDKIGTKNIVNIDGHQLIEYPVFTTDGSKKVVVQFLGEPAKEDGQFRRYFGTIKQFKNHIDFYDSDKLLARMKKTSCCFEWEVLAQGIDVGRLVPIYLEFKLQNPIK